MIEPQGQDRDTMDRLTRRSIRSFVIRNGRMTDAQADAVRRLMPLYGIDASSDASLHEAFERNAPLRVEVGIGNGDALLSMAAANPDVDFVGIEVHAPGIGHALLGIERDGLQNVRLIRHDAIEVLQTQCAAVSLEQVLLFFPDPWHKKRHHKRRIVQRDFLDAVAQTLSPGGLLHCATDIDDYALWMHEHLDAHPAFANTIGGRHDAERPAWRARTRFERRGTRLGHAVHDLLYSKI